MTESKKPLLWRKCKIEGWSVCLSVSAYTRGENREREHKASGKSMHTVGRDGSPSAPPGLRDMGITYMFHDVTRRGPDSAGPLHGQPACKKLARETPCSPFTQSD